MSNQSKRERLGATAGIRAKRTYSDTGSHASWDAAFTAWCKRRGIIEDPFDNKRRKKTEREEL